MPADAVDRLRLARTDGVGPVTYRRLLRRHASAAEALDALPGLARAGGKAGPPEVPSPAAARRELDRLGKLGGQMLFLDCPGYPPALAAFDPAPPLLSVLGNAALLCRRAVALVGARNASINGQRMAELLAADLAMAGLVVVSGMARGVDAAAHEGALRNGRTVAAVAGGVDVSYPPENTDLQRRVAEGGAVVAEAPLGTAPQARHFPRAQPGDRRPVPGRGGDRGRAALRQPHHGADRAGRGADGVRRAGFAAGPALPRIEQLAAGGRGLDGKCSDVTGHLPLAIESPTPTPTGFAEDRAAFDAPLDLAAVVQQVAALLSHSPTPVDDLVRRCQLSVHAVQAALVALELNHRVQMLPGNQASLIG